MHIAVVGNPGSWYGRQLQQAAQKRGHRCSRIDFCQMTGQIAGSSSGLVSNDVDLEQVDVLIVRTMPPGSLEQVVFRMDALWRLEAAGVIVLNSPKSIECAVDKYLTTSRLEAAGLPVPATWVCEEAEAALEGFSQLGGDVVVKPIFGAEGRGITRVSDPEIALRTFRTLERISAVLYLQAYVEHEGFDIRALVLDGKVVGAIKRRADDDFRTNVSNGGRAESYTLTEVEHQWALAAAQAVGTRFAGVDLLYSRSGQGYVIEVNAVPGWRAFQKVTGIDVAVRLIEALE